MFGTDNPIVNLLTFIRPNFGGKVIFVGNPAQLLPVGESIFKALRAEYFSPKTGKNHKEIQKIKRKQRILKKGRQHFGDLF